jgi:Flp pilus assembly protein CpaB
LIVLGIVLALITGALVLFLTMGAGSGGSGGQTVAVVTAAQNLTVGMVLSPDQSGGSYARISEVFHVEHLPTGMVPADAVLFTNEADLENALKNQIITSPFFAGDILRHADGRLTALGAGPASSLANHDPNALPTGDVLMAIPAPQITIHQGDHIDLLATECVQANATAHGGCQVVQTTLQDLAIYMVSGNLVLVAITHQDALVLKMLVETAKLDFVLRKPGDDSPVTTQPIDPAWIIQHFGFTPP